MGILERLKNLLRHPSKLQSIESINQADIQSSINHSIIESIREEQKIPESPPSLELQKDSLQLGIAAGYTGKFIKDVESSLNRIESNMVTKDWFTSQFEDQTPKLIDLMKEHDESQQKRFSTIENLLNSLQKTATKVPEPLKTELFEQIRTIEAQLPITHKMQQLLSIVKEFGEINYAELATRLDITQSALRGLLSTTLKRTNKIQRFKKQGRGWVRFIS